MYDTQFTQLIAIYDERRQRYTPTTIPVSNDSRQNRYIYKTGYKLKTVISHEIVSNSGQYLYQTVPNNETSTNLTKQPVITNK